MKKPDTSPAQTRTSTLLSVAFAVVLAAGCSSRTADAVKAGTEREPRQDATPVAMEVRPPLADGIAAMPHLVGDSDAIKAINADLDKADARSLSERSACGAGPEAAPGEPGASYARRITHPMTGPDFVTVHETKEMDCGAYPSTSQHAATYDLTTGRVVDWPSAIPGLSLAASEMSEGGTYASAALGAWYGRKMRADASWPAECREYFDTDVLAASGFAIWADAKAGGVVVRLNGLAHFQEACGMDATLTVDDLRAFHASLRLIQAVTAAHAAGNGNRDIDPDRLERPSVG